MASRWLRDIASDGNGPRDSLGWGYYKKVLAVWLYRVMGFTLQSESCVAGSFVSTEKTGANGAFAGGSLTFTDATAASFTDSDRGKLIAIADNANPANAGIYQIASRSSSSSVVIDFKAGTGEYPAASSGLSWWIFDKVFELPTALGDYVRLQSRHTTGWALEIKNFYAYTSAGYAALRVAPLGNWSAEVLGNPYGTEGVTSVMGIRTADNSSASLSSVLWAEGDYDGEWLHFMQLSHSVSINYDGNAVGLYTIARVTPIESGVPDSDLLVFRGRILAYANTSIDGGIRGYAASGTASETARAYSWVTGANAQRRGGGFDHSYGGYLTSLGRNDLSRERNRRRGRLLEAFAGEPYAVDPLNLEGCYRLLGYLKGHWVMPIQQHVIGSSYPLDPVDNARMSHKMAPINMGADRNRIHVVDGIVIPWCGLSVLGQGTP